MMFNLKTLNERFDVFAQAYLASTVHNPENFELKYEHTLQVLDNCKKLVEHTRLEKHICQCALAACLFHDTGRFPQYYKYGTFKDGESVNHARLGAAVIARKKMLRGVPESIRRTVIGAVALHNRINLPSNTPQDLLVVTKIVRDCDKIDIMRVLLENIAKPDKHGNVPFMGLKEIPGRITEKVLESVESGTQALYTDMRCVNDFRLMLLSWAHDLNFKWSRNEMITRGYLSEIFDNLPQNPRLLSLRPVIERVLTD